MFPFHATPPTAIPRLRQTGSEFLRLGRTVYFDACSSLFAYCTERLGYSEDSATKRVRVARLAQQFPQVLDDLASGELHLTGLFLLSGHLTDDNAEQLLAEARGKSKRQLEELLARWFPRPAVPPTITPVTPEPVQGQLSTWSGAGTPAPPAQAPRPRVEPLSPESVRVEFSAHAAFRDKLEQARALLSHTVPSGDLATILERALDLLIERETKRRAGAGKPRKRRETKPGSRHVPVEVQRAVRERDGDQCTFTDAEGRRCSANRQSGRAGGAPSPDANGREALTRGKTLNATEFLTIEHIDPFAKGGPTTVDNCCLHGCSGKRNPGSFRSLARVIHRSRGARSCGNGASVRPRGCDTARRTHAPLAIGTDSPHAPQVPSAVARRSERSGDGRVPARPEGRRLRPGLEPYPRLFRRESPDHRGPASRLREGLADHAGGEQLLPPVHAGAGEAAPAAARRRAPAVLGLSRPASGRLNQFRDILIADSTVIRLHELLAKTFPACRTNHTRAAAKVHVVMCVAGAGKQTVKVTAERRHDRRALVLGPWARGKLLLFDLGYFDFRLFRRLDEIRGYFVSRLKRSSNPVIVAQNRRWRGRSVAVVGQCIWDVVDRLQREELDVTVQVRSRHRVYAGRCSSEVRTFRVVGVRDEASGEYHLYITNIGVEALQPADIARVYAVRWEVELLFKELKSHYRLDQIPSRKRAVVEAMLYAALLSLAASRALLHALRSAVRPGFLLPARRWSVLMSQHATDLLAVVIEGRDDPVLLDLLLHEAPDPNRRRLHLLQSVERRAHAYRAPGNSASSRRAAA
ncbi:MAG: IS4 family transposase [Polyangiaceae bacterium]|nr:IS4 family transposase [Polyangiaceae bacterium]